MANKTIKGYFVCRVCGKREPQSTYDCDVLIVCKACDVSHSQQGEATMRTIGEFELIDHGIEHSQYFQGCGVAFTRFDNVTTGIGDNPAEAIDDCLEQVAQAGFDTEGMEAQIMAQEGLKAIPTTPSVLEEWGGECELYYHVSIRWNES